jgi:hypothetical protein
MGSAAGGRLPLHRARSTQGSRPLAVLRLAPAAAAQQLPPWLGLRMYVAIMHIVCRVGIGASLLTEITYK